MALGAFFKHHLSGTGKALYSCEESILIISAVSNATCAKVRHHIDSRHIEAGTSKKVPKQVGCMFFLLSIAKIHLKYSFVKRKRKGMSWVDGIDF